MTFQQSLLTHCIRPHLQQEYLTNLSSIILARHMAFIVLWVNIVDPCASPWTMPSEQLQQTGGLCAFAQRVCKLSGWGSHFFIPQLNPAGLWYRCGLYEPHPLPVYRHRWKTSSFFHILEALHLQGANEVELKNLTDTKALETEQGKTVPPTSWLDLCPFQVLLWITRLIQVLGHGDTFSRNRSLS